MILASDMKKIENDLLHPNKVLEKLIELEDSSQRNNLRLDGIIENTRETQDDYEEKVQEVL